MLSISKLCIICGTEFFCHRTKQSKFQRCCSKECENIRRKGIRFSPRTEFKKGQPAHNFKGGKFKDKYGYIRIRKKDHHRANQTGYVYEHIVIWEESNNKILPADWVIHHYNGIKDDNRPENLVGMPRKNHSPSLDEGLIKERLREVEKERDYWRKLYEGILYQKRDTG